MLVMAVLCGSLAACAQVAEEEEELHQPATLEPIEGSETSRITLTAEAAERVGIEVDPVLATGSGSVIPYAAVFYTAAGDTWTYTNPEPLTFVRVPIIVDHIEGDRAFLSEGPASGVEVVTQGSSELYGTETEVEE
jgi:hypothetical protein